jgi:hypothetical protein
MVPAIALSSSKFALNEIRFILPEILEKWEKPK